MKKNLWKKGLVLGIMVLFLGMSIVPVVNSTESSVDIKKLKVNEDLESDNNVYVQPGKQLTRKHLVFLKIALPYIKDSKIKQSVQDIITEIMNDGDATSDEIQVIIESNNVDASEVYILARVKTTDDTGGNVNCFPGLFRLLLIRSFFAKGICYANYEWWTIKNEYDWYLTINGKLVSKGQGYIFGYFGYVYYWTFGDPHYPDPYFILNGFGVLIIHK